MSAARDKEKARERPNKTWKDRLKGHKDTICFLTSPENGQMLSISADACLRIYDLEKRQSRKLEFAAPKPEALELDRGSAAAASRNGYVKPLGLCTAFAHHVTPGVGREAAKTTILGGYENGRIAAWDGDDGDLIGNFVGHTNVVSMLRCKDRDLLSSSVDGTIRIWSMNPLPQPTGHVGECRCILEFGESNPVADFALLKHDRLAACSWDGHLRTIDLKTSECINIREVSATSGLRVLVAQEQTHGDDATIFVGTDDCQICQWRVPFSGEPSEVRHWKAHDQEVTILKLYNDRLFSASEDRTVRVWDPRSGYFLDEMRGHDGAIMSFCIAEKLAWTGSRDTTIRSWCLMDMELRIWERGQMRRADLFSHQVEKYNAIMGPGKKKGAQKKAGSSKKQAKRGKSR